MDDFYTARSKLIPPLPWPTFAPPFSRLHELYGIEVSPDLISTFTNSVLEEVIAKQQRRLDLAYALVFSMPFAKNGGLRWQIHRCDYCSTIRALVVFNSPNCML